MVINLAARRPIGGSWIIFSGPLAGGERVECDADGNVKIFTESVDKIPALIEEGKKILATQKKRHFR